MRDASEVTRKRVAILHRGFMKACDDTSPYQIEDLKKLRERFAVNAGVLKVPDKHKWLLKLTKVFENMTSMVTPRDRMAGFATVNAIYNDNEMSFRFVDPDSCQLGLQKITLPGGGDNISPSARFN